MHRHGTIVAALLATGLLLATGCGPRLTPFTQRLQDENRWSQAELKSIQFYLSEDLVLTRDVVRGNSEIISGEIRVREGRQVEQMVLRRRTPGILLFLPKEDRFAVSFDDRDDRRYLVFGPNPRAGGKYTLRASEWERTGGQVTYDGKQWRVSSRHAYASLMVDLRKMRQVSTRTDRATGRRVR